MNLSELKQKLEENQIREDVYSLYGADYAERLVFSSLPNAKWQVYYSERGLKTNLKEFNSETDACLFFLKTLLNEPLAKKKKV